MHNPGVNIGQILEEGHTLSFHLQQQRLIELVRQGRTEEALEFAQEYLAPWGEDSPQFQQELGVAWPMLPHHYAAACHTYLLV